MPRKEWEHPDMCLGVTSRQPGTVFPANVTFLQENVFERTEDFERLLDEAGPFDLVMSDMAPRTTGTRFTDQARSLELCLEAVKVADRWLKPAEASSPRYLWGLISRNCASSEKALFLGQNLQTQQLPGRKQGNF